MNGLLQIFIFNIAFKDVQLIAMNRSSTFVSRLNTVFKDLGCLSLENRRFMHNVLWFLNVEMA